MVDCINLIIEMSPRFILGRENVPCVAEVVNRSLKADCTDYTSRLLLQFDSGKPFANITDPSEHSLILFSFLLLVSCKSADQNKPHQMINHTFEF